MIWEISSAKRVGRSRARLLVQDVHQAEDALPAIRVRHVDVFQKAVIAVVFVARPRDFGPLEVITEIPRIPVWQKDYATPRLMLPPKKINVRRSCGVASDVLEALIYPSAVPVSTSDSELPSRPGSKKKQRIFFPITGWA